MLALFFLGHHLQPCSVISHVGCVVHIPSMLCACLVVVTQLFSHTGTQGWCSLHNATIIGEGVAVVGHATYSVVLMWMMLLTHCSSLMTCMMFTHMACFQIWEQASTDV
jgi:hypothetical protein